VCAEGCQEPHQDGNSRHRSAAKNFVQGKDKLSELNDRFKTIGQQLFSDYLTARVFVLPDAPQRQIGMPFHLSIAWLNADLFRV
jgi:hypothetical protein